jgi:putative solute:sodium symporter small subunit
MCAERSVRRDERSTDPVVGRPPGSCARSASRCHRWTPNRCGSVPSRGSLRPAWHADRACSSEGSHNLMDESQREQYWRTNLRLTAILLTIWFVVSIVFSILLVESLNNIVILGFPMGFWWAQQGSIITFVILIGIYVWRMDRLDDEYGVSDRE